MVKTEQTLPEPLARWVSASDFVADSWLADYYDPDFLALEHQFTENRSNYIALGELVRVIFPSRFSRDEEATTLPVRWLATLRERKIAIQQVSFIQSGDASVLPPESILLPRLLFSRESQHPVRLWREDIWGGVGTAKPSLIVLSPSSSTPIAWIARELSQPYCQKQIQRLGNPSTFQPILLVSDLLRIRIKRLAPDEQQFATDLVLRELRMERERSSSPVPDELTSGDREYLPGATFEERRRHFEESVLPSLDAQLLAFVEASTTNRNSDLFAMRLIAEPVNQERLHVEFSDRRVTNDEKWWREWYWNGTENGYLVCHALTQESNPVLPAYLFERLLPCLIDPASQAAGLVNCFKGWKRTRGDRILLPTPGQLQELVGLLTGGGVGISDVIELDGLLPKFLDTDSENELLPLPRIFDAFEILKQAFRPLLMVRVVRDGGPVGVYVLAGNRQFDDPAAEKLRLEGLGDHLLQTLQPKDDILREATRKESLRRLSWFAHQINGPIGIADAALRDVQDCLGKNPNAACMLVPDDMTAHRMAAMAGQPIENYQIQNRVDAAMQAIHALRRVNYQIRQLRRIQGDIALAPCKLLPIVKAEIQHARESLPNLRIREIDLTDEEIEADAQLLKEAFQEVFNNSIREFKTRKTEEPKIDVTISHTQGWVRVSISDNGLPSLANLIDQPFEEDSSTYSQQGHGSGLGLTVVREIIMRHNGTCSLTPNFDEDEDRVPGVTFICNLPLASSLQNLPTL